MEDFFMMFLQVCISFVLDYLFRTFVLQTLLEDRESGFLERREHVCFLAWIIKIMAPSVARFGQVFYKPILKDWSCLNFGFFSCDINLLHVQHPSVFFSTSPPWDLGRKGSEGNEKLLLPEAIILSFISRESLVSCQLLGNCSRLTCGRLTW